MKRKVYMTARERRIDQIIGFVAFPMVNAVVWAANWSLARIAPVLHAPYDLIQVYFSLLPWIVNGLLLVLAFLFRPHIGIGYLACAGVTACVPVAVCGLFLWACFGVSGAASISNQSLSVGAVAVWLVLGIALCILFLLGVGVFAFMIWQIFRK